MLSFATASLLARGHEYDWEHADPGCSRERRPRWRACAAFLLAAWGPSCPGLARLPPAAASCLTQGGLAPCNPPSPRAVPGRGRRHATACGSTGRSEERRVG